MAWSKVMSRLHHDVAHLHVPTNVPTKKNTPPHNFERNLAMMVIYLPVKFEFDWTNRVRVRKRKCGWTLGQTDGCWTHQSNFIFLFKKMHSNQIFPSNETATSKGVNDFVSLMFSKSLLSQ